jgi:hypothetical protein
MPKSCRLLCRRVEEGDSSSSSGSRVPADIAGARACSGFTGRISLVARAAVGRISSRKDDTRAHTRATALMRPLSGQPRWTVKENRVTAPSQPLFFLSSRWRDDPDRVKAGWRPSRSGGPFLVAGSLLPEPPQVGRLRVKRSQSQSAVHVGAADHCVRLLFERPRREAFEPAGADAWDLGPLLQRL